jgi:hypothetical protein
VFTARYGLSLYIKFMFLFHDTELNGNSPDGPTRVANMLEFVGPSTTAVSVVVLNFV